MTRSVIQSGNIPADLRNAIEKFNEDFPFIDRLYIIGQINYWFHDPAAEFTEDKRESIGWMLDMLDVLGGYQDLLQVVTWFIDSLEVSDYGVLYSTYAQITGMICRYWARKERELDAFFEQAIEFVIQIVAIIRVREIHDRSFAGMRINS